MVFQGTPQEGVLSPRLWLLTVNDILMTINREEEMQMMSLYRLMENVYNQLVTL